MGGAVIGAVPGRGGRIATSRSGSPSGSWSLSSGRITTASPATSVTASSAATGGRLRRLGGRLAGGDGVGDGDSEGDSDGDGDGVGEAVGIGLEAAGTTTWTIA